MIVTVKKNLKKRNGKFTIYLLCNTKITIDCSTKNIPILQKNTKKINEYYCDKSNISHLRQNGLPIAQIIKVNH